ncbi:pelargonidin 3-O-(6-caffeoylglucoside) 5-O-(6-O-malonylglucoside) 4'''-malonyltransferase-like [Salvia hispanica]|uniref:pelargonidin 3-O-(6-caffeoylglucoside) 5-O-(6-O-malonylglucoside) 4'''-malonyltransferase-like n=1 Tax=Salvia hispanica TaxID=49212 RepID=UPI002009BC3F|nr:pelargonidin 3-O-(6-caffeoylglucoside) 5-O-(6-O-malonylglucoside) 4'''-malonyltransferase-like [Salvia hispanica]
MKVKVVSKRLVKPRTPTPQNLKTYKISFMDELNPTMHVVGMFYYKSPASAAANLDHLQDTLSSILPAFYPFAGRYMKQHRVVDCSDQGALLIEANVDLQLLEVMNLDAVEELNDILPCEIGEADEETDPILLVQLTRFKCGGVAISICISHRVIDAGSLGTFISAWTNTARGETREEICPVFNGPVFFPGRNFPAPEFGTTRDRENGLYSIICKRFLFNKNTISSLKEKVGKTSEQPRPPSRIGVVSGLIVKAIDRARAHVGPATDLVVAQAVNIRERTVPPLAKHSCGNLVALSITKLTAEESKKMGVEDYVRVLGSDARKTVRDCAGLISEEGKRSWIQMSHEVSEMSLREDVNVVWVTDWSKFGFYEADFGWGKPEWASVANVMVKNHVTLMDTKEGDGIEAWVQLEDTEMPYFENQIRNFISA